MGYRAQSPVGPGSFRTLAPDRAVDDRALKGGNLFISNIDAPSEVQSGETFEVGVTVSNGANIITSFDPSSCDQPNPQGVGYDYTTSIQGNYGGTFSDTADSAGGCIGTTERGTVDQTKTLSLAAPFELGEWAYRVLLRLKNESNLLLVERTVNVVESEGGGDGDAECQSSADCPPGHECVTSGLGSGGVCVETGDDGGDGGDGGDDDGDGSDGGDSQPEPDCSRDADCPGDQICSDMNAPVAICQPPGDTGGCTADVDCSGSMVCQDGECVQPGGGPMQWWNSLSQNEKLIVGAGGALAGAAALRSLN